jgi:hypothetical protein
MSDFEKPKGDYAELIARLRTQQDAIVLVTDEELDHAFAMAEKDYKEYLSYRKPGDPPYNVIYFASRRISRLFGEKLKIPN